MQRSQSTMYHRHHQDTEEGGRHCHAEEQISRGRSVARQGEQDKENRVVDDAGDEGHDKWEEGTGPIDGQLTKAGQICGDGQSEGARPEGQAREEVKS